MALRAVALVAFLLAATGCTGSTPSPHTHSASPTLRTSPTLSTSLHPSPSRTRSRDTASRRWQASGTVLGFAGPEAVSFVSATQGFAMTPGRCRGCARIWRTNDSGRHWQVVAPALQVPGRQTDVYDGETDLDFVDRQVGYLFVKGGCVVGCVLLTVDAGRTWRLCELPAVDSIVNGAGAVYALTSADRHRSQNVLRARVGSARWTRLDLDIAAVDGPASLAAEQHVVVVLQAGKEGPRPEHLGRLFVSTDRGHSFLQRANPCTARDGGATLVSIAKQQPRSLLVDCYNGMQSSQESSTKHHLYSSSDSGRTWRRVGTAARTGGPAELLDNGAGSAFLVTYGGAGYRLWATIDGAAGWHAALIGTPREFALGDLRFVTPSVGFALAPTHYAPEKLFRTVDGGRSWYRISTPTGHTRARSSVQRCAPRRIAVTSSGGGEAMSHVDLVLKFVNATGTSCRMSGWPHVYGLRGTRRVAAKHTRADPALRRGRAVGLPHIVLAPGGAAYAVAVGSDVRFNQRGRVVLCGAPFDHLLAGLSREAVTGNVDTTRDFPQGGGFPSCGGLSVTPLVPASAVIGTRR